MIRPEVVAYLQAHLKQHPIEELRRQLAQEGISGVDIDDSLKAAMRAPAPAPGHSGPSRSSLALLVLGVGLAAALAALSTLRREPAHSGPAANTVVSATGESAFVGSTGYVIRLPKRYDAAAAFKDERRSVEIVHFYPAGTDPTNFVNKGLFGQLGIVGLEVQPNPWSGDITGPEKLARFVSAQAAARGDKFSVKNLQVSSLRGVQVQTELPEPSVEAFILGETAMYHFYAGQDDEVYREILNSLRDPHAEAL